MGRRNPATTTTLPMPSWVMPPPPPAADAIHPEAYLAPSSTPVIAAPTAVGQHEAPAPLVSPVPAPASVGDGFTTGQPRDPAPAVQHAVCYAIDFAAWDEAPPHQRERVLRRRYFPDPTVSVPPSLRGYSGDPQRHPTFAVPGQVRRDEVDPDVVWVAVAVRFTPIIGESVRAVVSADTSRPDADPDHALLRDWVHFLIAVRQLPGGRLVIDPEIDPAGLESADVESVPTARGA